MKTAGLIYSVFIHGVAPTRRSYTGPGGNTDNIARKINIFPLAKIATPLINIHCHFQKELCIKSSLGPSDLMLPFCRFL